MEANVALLTVVTVVLNGAQTLERAFKSVFDQRFDDLDYVVIDGGSTDGTLDIIRKYESRLGYWRSEPDNGLYPTWSPDGLKIAFMSWRNGHSQIFTSGPDGSGTTAVVTMPNGDAISPRWSPDGNYIAFVHVPEGGVTGPQEATQQRIVYVVELASGRLSRVSK